MDFYHIGTREIERGPNKGQFEIFPDFIVGRSKDLMVRGGRFYAIWDEERNLWSTDEYDVQRLIDQEMDAYALKAGPSYHVSHLRSFRTKSWIQFRMFMQNVSDNSHQLDENLTFANSDTKKSDYVSRRLPYSLAPGDHSAWDELVGVLYAPEEKEKIEWAIGAIVSGDSKKIQKFLVLYGPAGTGKSTVLNIVESLFKGYSTTFEAKALGQNSNAFATEAFKNNPLVAIQHDGDLSKIEDNTKLNSIISHEEMTMNEKYKPSYTSRVNAFLFMGTNQPVRISDAKSGIIRRLIDVHPTGVTIPAKHYQALMSRIEFELGAISTHCLETYRTLGKNYYNAYRPLEMMLQTDIFFNFIEANYDIFRDQDGATLAQAYSLYKEFCDDTGIERILPQYKFREELRNYFDEFRDRTTVNGVALRSVYVGFNATKFKSISVKDHSFSLVVDETISLLDEAYKDQPAQYAIEDGIPAHRWSSVKTVLSDLNTTQLHFVKPLDNHIVIDFDLKDKNGEKSLEKNLEAASLWPATYAELSRGGAGVHLHYAYEGDPSALSSVYAEGIEIKTFLGNSSLRRKVSRCNLVPIASISTGLPFKEKKVLGANTIQSEKGLRDLIIRNLNKEIHPGTKPSVDFIQKILDDANASGMQYDVTDLRSRIMAFANNSTNQPLQALKVVQKMKFSSEIRAEDSPAIAMPAKDARIVFFDVEVFPNLFIICWKYEDDPVVVRMINPPARDVEALFQLKLVGFNNRRFDNHILYGAMMGYDNEALFNLSQKLIANDRNATFGEAYNLSYTDIWDFSSKKQSLKLFEIELKIPHKELNLPWTEPVPEEKWAEVADYCVNDVMATEATWKDRAQDFVARQILSELSGLSVNSTTQAHTAKIIFGDDKNARRQFVYTDLSKEFPGYQFDMGKSTYLGEEPGEGGWVYSQPGMYDNVGVLDVASMHPTSIIVLNQFGEYTPNFAALVEARIAIKNKRYDDARKMLGGKLAKFLSDPEMADALAYALKIVINIVYGLTSAKFENPFKDNRNVDNIVAKRGALFMINLKNYVEDLGYTVVHIKTDSIKIPDIDQKIIDLVTAYGKKYGYTFEHEDTYKKFCLVNDAVYVARKSNDEWETKGAQFQHPYVKKMLFTHEPIVFDDLCETKSVLQGAMWLDFEAMNKPIVMNTGMQFVGRTGRFVPVMPESGGGILYRIKDDKTFAVTGTKGFLWMEADIAEKMGDKIEIDMSYFDRLVDEAQKTIDYYGPLANFIK